MVSSFFFSLFLHAFIFPFLFWLFPSSDAFAFALLSFLLSIPSFSFPFPCSISLAPYLFESRKPTDWVCAHWIQYSSFMDCILEKHDSIISATQIQFLMVLLMTLSIVMLRHHQLRRERPTRRGRERDIENEREREGQRKQQKRKRR